MRATAWLLPALLSACYLSPEKHRVVDEPAQADDAGLGEMDGSDPPTAETGSIEAGALADSSHEVEVDAGCTSHEVCPVSAPVCREGSCIACAQHGDCARFASTPACGPMGACVVCATDATARCTGATPACDPSTNQCVACTADSHCTGATPACDPNTKQCVQCTADSHCPSEQRAACGADRSCGGCSEDADCARFSKVCERSSGECVECRPDTEEADCRSDRSCDPTKADCAGTACDPKLLTCTEVSRHTLGTCQPCVSDSECVDQHRCVPLAFGEGAMRRELGGFCMKQSSAGCAVPYRSPVLRASLSGEPAAEYCGINEVLTSCAAVIALEALQSCSPGSANLCGGAAGARCETVNAGANTCTYACINNVDCPSNLPCGGASAEERYCGASSQ